MRDITLTGNTRFLYSVIQLTGVQLVEFQPHAVAFLSVSLVKIAHTVYFVCLSKAYLSSISVFPILSFFPGLHKFHDSEI